MLLSLLIAQFGSSLHLVPHFRVAGLIQLQNLAALLLQVLPREYSRMRLSNHCHEIVIERLLSQCLLL
jgi:hypothetical protein